MDIIALIGRILFAALFLGSGVNHLTQSAAMVPYAQAKKVPMPQVAVIGSGVVMIVGGLMVLLGAWGDLGALLLVVFLIPTAVLMHNFWAETDPQARQMEMANFLKNLSLAGGALIIMAHFASGKAGLTITGPLFGGGGTP